MKSIAPRIVMSLSLVAALPSCGKTPVDAILSRSDAVADCVLTAASLAPGVQFRLRAVATGRCLSAGQPIVVSGTPALLTAMLDDCTFADIWEVDSAAMLDAFEVVDTRVDRNLDIERAGTIDGTRAILYSSLGLQHQQFSFTEQTDGVFQIAPLHAPLKCLAEAAPSPQIFTCSADALEQKWELLSDQCE